MSWRNRAAIGVAAAAVLLLIGVGGYAEPVPRAFVSPNVGELSFEQAKSEISSQRQQMLIDASIDVDKKLGISGEETNVIGAWSDGAENSLMITMPGATWAEALVASAMKGHLADQKQVLVFEPRKDGDEFMATFSAKGKMDKVHQELLHNGLASHTLEQTKTGVTVYVYGKDQKTLEAVSKAAGLYGTKAEITRGTGKSIGTQLEKGSDRELRDDARRDYERVIAENAGELRGRDVQAIWQDVRDHWSGPLSKTEVGTAAPLEGTASGSQPAR